MAGMRFRGPMNDMQSTVMTYILGLSYVGRMFCFRHLESLKYLERGMTQACILERSSATVCGIDWREVRSDTRQPARKRA